MLPQGTRCVAIPRRVSEVSCTARPSAVAVTATRPNRSACGARTRTRGGFGGADTDFTAGAPRPGATPAATRTCSGEVDATLPRRPNAYSPQ